MDGDGYGYCCFVPPMGYCERLNNDLSCGVDGECKDCGGLNVLWDVSGLGMVGGGINLAWRCWDSDVSGMWRLATAGWDLSTTEISKWDWLFHCGEGYIKSLDPLLEPIPLLFLSSAVLPAMGVGIGGVLSVL